MSKAALSDFLLASSHHLGLNPYHGDTSSHPYVCPDMAIIVTKEAIAPVQVKPQAQPQPLSTSVQAAAKAPLNWHAQYCLNKFGKMTPGNSPR